VPTGQPAGNLTDTAALAWQDANNNNYGPVSSSFTTAVSNNLAGASLTLSPATAGPDVVGTSQAFTAVLLDHNGAAIDNQAVILSITGANPTTQAATTYPNGSVNFSYSGANRGTDQVQASVISGALTLQSNTVSVAWITPIRAVSTTLVNATVYHGSCCGFSATPTTTPVFTIQVPTINFNPPAGTVPHNPTGVGVFSRPMTDVTTDVAGNFTGAITLQGFDASNVLHQAGSGDLFEFDMVLTGNFTIAQSGSLTYNFFSDDGFIFGVKGATRISGPLVNPPASMLTPFNGYTVLGAYDQPTAPVANNVTVSFPAPGVYPYEIDYNECCSGQLALTLATGGSGLPPTGNISLTPFNIPAATVGQTQTLHVSVMDASGVALANQPITITITGANPQQLPGVTDSTGLATLTYQAANAGLDTLQVSSQVSGVPELSNLVTVTWNPAPPAPTISAPTPFDGSLVEKPVSITASITPPAGQTIASWQITLQALDPGPVITLNSGTGPPPPTLAVLDPTLLPNDTYNISVSATASGGGVQTASTTVVVFGSLKPGRYQTTYQDLSVPVNGFPMEVRRTYDSIDKSPGDFGVGWRVSVANFRTAPNRALGAAGWTQYNLNCGLGLCLTAFKNSAPRFVSVTFPDQHTEVFDFVPSGGTNIFFGGAAVFRARAGTGTTSTLEVSGDASLNYTGDGNLYGATGSLFNPQRFKLTTLDGTALILDSQLGLVSETDRNTNALNIDASGIHSSSGQSVTYARDGSSRITQITGPSSQTLSYTYSAAGDLATSTDPNGNQTIYTYDSNHDLLKAVGGSQPLQTLNYDPSGRLIAIADALGHTTTVSNDIPGQKQTVTDPLGRLTTIYTLDDLGDVLRIDRVSGGQTQTTAMTYDAVGQALTRTDPLAHVWTGSYDANGDLLSVRPPSGSGMSLAYDSFGLPLNITDAVSNQTTMAYDAAGNLASITDALGQVSTFIHDRLGNRTHFTDALGKTWDYTYDGAGHTTSITDPQGHGIGFAYDSSGRMTSAGDALGRVTNYTYDAMGHLASATDALGGRTSYTYNPQGHVASRTDALGKVTTYAYDSNNQLTAVTDPLGHVARYSYDADGRLAGQIDAGGGTTSYVHDGFGRLASQTDAIGRITSYAYDLAGQLVGETLPNGGKYAYAYNDQGRQVSVTDPLGRISTLAYDAAGRVVSSTDPMAALKRISVDALGRMVSSTDPLGHTTSNGYDAAGNLISVTNALGEKTTYSYDGAGNRTASTDPLGRVTTYGYDSNNRLVAVVDPLGRTTHSTYDLVGRLSSVIRQTGSTTAYTYDALGNQTAITDHLGNSTTFAYDGAGRKTTSTDPKGNITRFGYDAAGRQVSITDALGGVVHLTYDASGQQTTLSNPRGDTSTFAYDALGNVATRTDPAGQSTSHTYDAAGQLVSQIDPRGVHLNFTYDASGRMTGTTFPGGALTFSYDTAGRETSMVDPTGMTKYGYDGTNRLISAAAPAGTVGYTYDAAGRRTSLSQPVRGSIGYSYDAAGQLVSLRDWVGRAFSFVYTPDGQPLQVTGPEGVRSTYGYDSTGRLLAVHNDGSFGGGHYDYTFDANGNRTSVTSGAGTENYTYDALNRLVAVTYPNGDTTTYSYDVAGNQLTKKANGATTNYTYDSSGRLASAGGTTFTYDAAGNLMASGSNSYTWDWADRLTAATVNGTNSSYTYDGQGLRVAAQNGTSTSTYLWDRATSLPTLIDDGSQSYLHTDQGVIEQSGPATGSPTFPLADGLGSVRNIADATGSVVASTSYDAFGSVRSQSGSAGIFGFTGEQTDPTGLSFLRARYYDSTVGRFLSADSVQPNAEGTQGYNPYSYVANNPTTSADPSGHLALEVGVVDANAARNAASVGAVADAEAVALAARLAVWKALLAEMEREAAQAAAREALKRGVLVLGAAVVVSSGVGVCLALECGPFAKPGAGTSTGTGTGTGTGAGTPDPPLTDPRPDGQECPITGQPQPAFRIAGVPVLCVYFHETPGIYLNDAIAQTRFPGFPPNPLHFEPNAAAQQTNRNAAMKGEPDCPNVPGFELSRDEYPYASSKEGGVYDGQKANVLCVLVSEQKIQQKALRTFYFNELKRGNNAPFYVVPVLY
jgi:RHS repeat-associated protein